MSAALSSWRSVREAARSGIEAYAVAAVSAAHVEVVPLGADEWTCAVVLTAGRRGHRMSSQLS